MDPPVVTTEFTGATAQVAVEEHLPAVGTTGKAEVVQGQGDLLRAGLEGAGRQGPLGRVSRGCSSRISRSCSSCIRIRPATISEGTMSRPRERTKLSGWLLLYYRHLNKTLTQIRPLLLRTEWHDVHPWIKVYASMHVQQPLKLRLNALKTGSAFAPTQCIGHIIGFISCQRLQQNLCLWLKFRAYTATTKYN